MINIKRILPPPKGSFFLFGPRGTGKSTWLKREFGPDLTIDLLRSETFLELSAQPSRLRERVEPLPKGSKIVIDEIQKLPVLLDEVHSLIFDHGKSYQFALTGSSARKLKQVNANMLAGRAIRREMFPLTSAELGKMFNIQSVLGWGALPAVYLEDNEQEKNDFLYTYVSTYLREEIQMESFVRNLQGYHRFLKHMAIMNAQVLNLNNISREAGIARSTLDGYVEILTDTLLGYLVEPIHLKAKIKEVSTPKFYFFDCGVVRAIRGDLGEPLGETIGHLLETFILNEIKAYSSYFGKHYEIYYWGTPSEAEVDFVICKGKHRWAVEVKSAKKWKREFNKGLHSASSSQQLDALIGVYLGKEILKTEDITVLPVDVFCQKLFAGQLFT